MAKVKLTNPVKYFKQQLKKYNLFDALVCFATASSNIFHDQNVGDTPFACDDFYLHGKRETVHQAALAYLANLALISNANDNKARFLSTEIPQFMELIETYNNNFQDLPDELFQEITGGLDIKEYISYAYFFSFYMKEMREPIIRFPFDYIDQNLINKNIIDTEKMQIFLIQILYLN